MERGETSKEKDKETRNQMKGRKSESRDRRKISGERERRVNGRKTREHF